VSERLERLLNLTAALLTAARPMTSADIAARVPGYPDPVAQRDAFQRAFERDKTALREMGIPILLDELPGIEPPEAGYHIRREDYALRDPGLDADELAALHLALAAVRLDGLPGLEALWKLGGSEGATGGEPSVALPASPHLVPLFGAVAGRSTVRFSYRSEARTVDPFRLSFSKGHWYLDGHDHDRVADRQFRLDRIDGDIEVGDADAFPLPEPDASSSGPVQPWQLPGDEPVSARLRVDDEQANWAIVQLGEDAVVSRDADGVELAVTVTNRDGFRSFVLGFLDHAEILEPEELRADMIDWLEAVAAG
jgi:proteasome accessory factor B